MKPSDTLFTLFLTYIGIMIISVFIDETAMVFAIAAIIIGLVTLSVSIKESSEVREELEKQPEPKQKVPEVTPYY